jgi:hypothetical protein
MDIIKKFDFGGQELGVSFCFEALVEIAGDLPLSEYLEKYTSIKNQIEILRIGLKYAGNEKTHMEVRELAKANPRTLFHVFKAYEAEAGVFYTGYFDLNGEEKPKELSPEEKKKNEEAGKPGALDPSKVN